MADIAVLGFDIDSTPARTAATDLAKLQNAATKLAREMSKTDTVLRRSNGQFASSAEVVERYGSEVQQLAAKYNPALNAVFKFQQAEAELNRALALGVVTNQQYEASLENVRNQLAANATASATAGAASQRLSRNLDNTAGYAGNVFSQFNDIGVMMASGQSPFVLALQQGTQLNQVWAQMGNSARGIGAAIRGAFVSMLNPVSLLTIGLIAGGAALFQWATGARDAKDGTDSLTKSVDALSSAVGRIGSTPNLMTPEGVAQVRTEYGFLSNEVRSLVAALAEVEMQQARMAAQTTIADILGNFEAGFFTTRMQAIIDATGLATEEARKFEIQLNRLAVADGPENQLAIVTQLRQRLQESGTTSGRLYESLVKTEAELRKLVKQSDDLSKGMRESGRYASLFSQTVAHTSMQHLVSQASALAGQLSAAAGAMDRISGGVGGAFVGGVVEAAGNAWDKALQRLQDIESGGLGDRPVSRPFSVSETAIYGPEASGGGGGGAGGGGGGGADQIEEDFKNRYEALVNGFKGEFDLSLTEYQKQLETLDWALNQKLIKEQEYQRNKQLLYTMTFGTEAEQNLLQYQLDQEALQTALDQKLITYQTYYERLKQMQFEYIMGSTEANQTAMAADLDRTSQYFAQLSSLAGGGFDGLLKAQRTFAATSALINAWKGYTDVLAQPGLPWWAKLAAAGKVLAAGLGAVSAIKGAGGGGGGGGGSSRAGSSASAAAQVEPTREVLVRLEGDDWLVSMADNLLTQIYEQSKDGRVVVARDRV